MPRKSVDSTDKFLNLRRSTSNINILLNETKLCHITTRLVSWFLKAYLSSRTHGTGEYPSMHWGGEGVHSVDKANITGLSHIHTLVVLNSLVFTLWDKIKAAAQFADTTESIRSLCSSIGRVGECKHVSVSRYKPLSRLVHQNCARECHCEDITSGFG